jgi:hypothetical protein
MSDDTVGGERAISRVGAQAGAGGAGGAGVAGGGPGAGGQTTTPAPAPSGPGAPTPTPPSDPPTVWHKGFAITSAIVVAVLLGAFVVVSQLFADNLGLDATETAKLDGRALIGARVIGPVTVVGVAVTLVGVWMAMTEWRGRFTEKAETGTGEREIPDPAKIIEALGKLRGAALVLISGIIILLGVAWMTSATASAPPAPAPTSTATGSPTT